MSEVSTSLCIRLCNRRGRADWLLRLWRVGRTGATEAGWGRRGGADWLLRLWRCAAGGVRPGCSHKR